MNFRYAILLLCCFSSKTLAVTAPLLPTDNIRSLISDSEKILKLLNIEYLDNYKQPQRKSVSNKINTKKSRTKKIKNKTDIEPNHIEKVSTNNTKNVSKKEDPSIAHHITNSESLKNKIPSLQSSAYVNNTPFFRTLTPQQNDIINFENTLVAGQISQPLQSLIINGIKTIIHKDGTFNQFVQLDTRKNTQFIPIWAITSSNKIVSFNITIHYAPLVKKNGNPNKQRLKTTLEQSILKGISTSYQALDWKIVTWDCPKNLQDTLGNKQYLALFNNNVCLTKGKKTILAFPLSDIHEPINTVSDRIEKAVSESQTPSKSVTLIWFNTNGEFWEMYYPLQTQSKHKGAYMWILENKEISPRQISDSQARRIMQFLKHPF